MKQIAIIGSGIAGNLAAAYLRKHHPELGITVIGKRDKIPPIVGESLTEFTTFLIHDIGMSAHLEREHYHKNGLTFYFKEDINNPEDRTYSVQEAYVIPPLPSNQLNRFTFDEALIEHNRDNGVQFVDARVKDVILREHGAHELHIKNGGDTVNKLDADWVIDASGRSRFLARKLNLQQHHPFQRSTFWFRLVDFDRTLLENIRAVKPHQYGFNSYYATHHFFGHGSWIWCIPMRSREHEEMISIGIVWRPDIQKTVINSLEGFLDHVSQENPVVAEMVQSGSVIDTNFYSNYMYEASQVYSRNGWFLVGDAADAVDPLYSTGLVMSSLQITQVSAMIEQDKAGTLTEQYVKDLELAYKRLRNTMQLEISTMYDVTHDPYQSHWRMHFVSAYYFFFLLPSWLSGYMTDSVGVRWLRREMEVGAKDFMSLLSLLPIAAKRLGKLPSEKIKNRYNISVNWNLWGPCERKIGRYYARKHFLFAYFRLLLLKDAGWHNATTHILASAKEFFRGVFHRIYFWNRPIKESQLVRFVLENLWDDRKCTGKPEIPTMRVVDTGKEKKMNEKKEEMSDKQMAA